MLIIKWPKYKLMENCFIENILKLLCNYLSWYFRNNIFMEIVNNQNV